MVEASILIMRAFLSCSRSLIGSSTAPGSKQKSRVHPNPAATCGVISMQRCSTPESDSSLWGRKMDFAICDCEGPWDNTVNTVKCFLNWFLCKMCHAWIIGYRSVLQRQRLCWAPVSLSPHCAGEALILWHRLVLTNHVHISRVIFSMIKHVENPRMKRPASAIRANQGF